MAMRVGAIGYYLPEEVTNDELLARVAAGSGPGVDLKRLERKLILNEAETRCFIDRRKPPWIWRKRRPGGVWSVPVARRKIST